MYVREAKPVRPLLELLRFSRIGESIHAALPALGDVRFQPTRVAVRVCACVPHTHTYI